jgi:hypothetical protein
MRKKTFIYNALRLSSVSICALFMSSNLASAQIDMVQKPVLVITNKPMASTNMAPIYSRPSRAPEITADQVLGEPFLEQGKTVVGNRIDDISKDLFSLQNTVTRLSEQLRSIETRDQNLAAGYYASVATINTQLQTGTTPGNPRLIAKLDTAQSNLDTLSQNMTGLNSLAMEISEATSKGSYLLDTTRSAFTLSGAIEEDHVRLSQIEDQVNATVVGLDRLSSHINDDIARITSYLATERHNLRTLALGVTDGNLYGRSLANHPFSSAPRSNLLQQASFNRPLPATSFPPTQQRSNAGARPLAKIKFDRPNINYEQPLYNAVQSAMQRFPNGRFELIAVHPSAGNKAQITIESTRSRRNAEQVLRKLTQMGVALNKIDMSTSASTQASTSEVHLFVR